MGRIPREARLIFAGLWSMADDHGRFPADLRLLACQLLPYDSDRDQVVKAALEVLEEEDCVRLYNVGLNEYGYMPRWKEHQRIDKPSSPKNPDPPDPSRALPEPSRALPEPSRILPGGREGKGREGSGREGKETLVEQARPVREVFKHWQAVMAKPKALLDDKRARAVKARLAEGRTVEDLKQAIDGCAQTPHNMGSNDRGEKFNDLELICRNGPNVERFLANATAPPRPEGKHPVPDEGIIRSGGPVDLESPWGAT